MALRSASRRGGVISWTNSPDLIEGHGVTAARLPWPEDGPAVITQTTLQQTRTPPVRRRGRKSLADDAKQRAKHIECLRTFRRHPDWSVERIARSLGISRQTAYTWRDLALAYPEAADLPFN